jgi:hypothetical protein
MMPDSSDKQRPRAIQDAINGVREFCQHQHKRLRLDHGRFVERYEKGEASLLIRVRPYGFDGNLIALFQRAFRFVQGQPGVQRRDKRRSLLSKKLIRPLRYINTDRCRSATACEQDTMLVDDVEFVDLPEDVIPSTIRLGSIDEIYSVLPHAFYLSGNFGIVGRGIFDDWIRDMVGSSVCASSNEIKLLREMVERGTKIVECVPDQNADDWRDRIDLAEIVDSISRLSIYIAADAIWIGGEELADSGIQILDVEFGPV